REIPPLRYDFVYRLKQEFPDLEIIINGGVQTNTQIAEHLQHVDGVMMGREAYHNPYIMHDWDTLFYGEKQPAPTREQIAQQLYNYATQQLSRQQGTILRHMVRHYLGLTHGLNGAKIWRRMLSDADLLRDNRPELILEAWQQVEKMQAAFESKG
ncbi:tRNA-dihydrouridine synthase, partial [Kingella kingae]